MESQCGHSPRWIVPNTLPRLLLLLLLQLLLLLSDYRAVVCFNVNTLSPEIYSSSRTSGFGFSVAQLAINDSKWLIIGAPFDEGNTTPDGAVYKCTQLRCDRMPFNVYGSRRTNSSFSMIGASVTTSQSDGLIIACAPRYSYYEEPFFSDEDPAIYMMGACFVYSGKDDTYRRKPYTPCQPGTNGILPINKQCAAGFSVSIMEGEDAFVIGAVGTNYYRGQYIRMELSRRLYPDYGLTGTNEGDYSGYGVATGSFSDGSHLDVVAGAPRARDHFGEVTVYRRLIGKGWQKLHTIHGRQFGEYFGSVLAVGDLNGDGLDDLVIGAPYHADIEQRVHEVGKVYVFYQENRDTRTAIFSDHVTELQGDVTSTGRFGFALSVLSDIDQDGFNDLAVGAPLDGATGAVYLYLGSSQGVSSRSVQAIRGSTYRQLGLSMFGSAISGSLDMDGNGYPDVLVGASGSGHSLLLKTHPVLTVNINLTTDITYLKLDDLKCDVILPASAISCVHLDTVLSCGGRHLQDVHSAVLRLTWTLNPDNSTSSVVLFVEDNSGQKVTNFSETLVIWKDRSIAKKHVIFITNAVVEYIPPITIQVKYQLINSPRDVSEPVLDVKTPVTKSTQFQVYRPPADLSLNVTSMSGEAVLGRGQQTEFLVRVHNMKAVPSYNGEINISLPRGVTYAGIEGPKSVTCLVPEDCQQTLICGLGFRFPPNSQLEFRLRTSIKNQTALFHMTSVTYEFNLTSVNDVDSSNDADDVTLQLASDVDLVITGSSSPDQLQVTADSHTQNITHSYKITNHGPSPLVAMEMWISWPVMTSDGMSLLVLDDVPLVSDDKGICHKEEHSLAPLSLSQLEMCNDGTPSLFCQKIHCVVRGVDGGESITLEIASTLSADVIKFSEIDNSLVLNSTVKAVGESIHGIPMSGKAIDHLTIQTRIRFPEAKREEKVSWWIYVIAICCGSILLVALVVALWKFGFFKRGTRERLYSAKRESNNLNWPNVDEEEDDGAIYPMTERVADAAQDDGEGVTDHNENDANNANAENDAKMNDIDECLKTLNNI